MIRRKQRRREEEKRRKRTELWRPSKRDTAVAGKTKIKRRGKLEIKQEESNFSLLSWDAFHKRFMLENFIRQENRTHEDKVKFLFDMFL